MSNLSKMMSYVLRHKPEEIGIKLDYAGWVDVDELLSALQSHGWDVDGDDLKNVVESNDKKRFSFSEGGTKIRANQGHSIKVDLGLVPEVPPAILYHGTATRFLKSIEQNGITKQSRHHVHLSADTETAVKVGQRHGKCVVLSIGAEMMVNDGIEFYKSDNGVWLTDFVDFDKYVFRLDYV